MSLLQRVERAQQAAKAAEAAAAAGPETTPSEPESPETSETPETPQEGETAVAVLPASAVPVSTNGTKLVAVPVAPAGTGGGLRAGPSPAREVMIREV